MWARRERTRQMKEELARMKDFIREALVDMAIRLCDIGSYWITPSTLSHRSGE